MLTTTVAIISHIFERHVKHRQMPLAARLVTALEKPQRNDVNRLSALAEALAALTARMETKDAAATAARGVRVLAKVPQNPDEEGDRELRGFNSHIAALAAIVPKAEQTRFAALSLMFLSEVPPVPKQGEPEAQERIIIARITALLSTQKLAEVLKWPFCVGEAQKLVLAELGKRTQLDFGGDLWKFVEQVDSLGVQGVDRKFLDLPARRPRIEDSMKELRPFIPATAQK